MDFASTQSAKRTADRHESPEAARKKIAVQVPAVAGDEAARGDNEYTDSGSAAALADLSRFIRHATRQTDDSIKRCGAATIHILHTDVDLALELAQDQLHIWPYKDVPQCWRRLYEDASLLKAAELLQTAASSEPAGHLELIVQTLDRGIALSGLSLRHSVYHRALATLAIYFESLDDESGPSFPPFNSRLNSQPLFTTCPVSRSSELAFDEFQQHLDRQNIPLLITDMLNEWPARTLWQDSNYLMRKTIGGNRLVPIEIGSTYVDEKWTQRLMPLKDYLRDYIFSTGNEVAYLAQHDLLAQVPALMHDIRTPDYCYTSPPPAPPTLPQQAEQLDEPKINAWFGPGGTRSPLHTDPYYNILCQVVGSKFVRLYPPQESSKLYAMGRTETGIDMRNTSHLDLSYAQKDVIDDRYPLAQTAAYQEVILAPGECLFIPAGWWHYVESLSVSFSVSFWWN